MQLSSIASASRMETSFFMQGTSFFIHAPLVVRNGVHPMGYPLTEPIMMPLTKYFCRKGYTQAMGTTLTMMAAACTVVAGGTAPSSMLPCSSSDRLLDSRISRSSVCSGHSLR
jgi:hypothetical protein